VVAQQLHPQLVDHALVFTDQLPAGVIVAERTALDERRFAGADLRPGDSSGLFHRQSLGHLTIPPAEYTRPPGAPGAAYIYEPDQYTLLDQIVPRFTALQVYQAVLEAQASEHAARMVAMRNATDNAIELVGGLRLAYNKARQTSITNEMLDIAGGAEALAKAG
jgi:hypothetical protein